MRAETALMVGAGNEFKATSRDTVKHVGGAVAKWNGIDYFPGKYRDFSTLVSMWAHR